MNWGFLRVILFDTWVFIPNDTQASAFFTGENIKVAIAVEIY